MPATSHATFPCFGGTCSVQVSGPGPGGPAEAAVAAGAEQLRAWDARFSRFRPDSELSRLNADPRAAVPASPLLRRLIRAIVAAAQETDGLVDATLLSALEQAGYRDSFSGQGLTLAQALPLAPARRAALGDPSSRWASVRVDEVGGTVVRPPGLRLDSGGLAKGLFADTLAQRLHGHAAVAVDCGGDLRLGGLAPPPREVLVTSPFDGSVVHALHAAGGGIATSGIGRRSWLDPDGAPAHHLLDPSTGRPAYTGIVQVTALAPTALRAELLAEAALLSGPDGLERWLPHGGLAIADDGRLVHVAGGSQRTPSAL